MNILISIAIWWSWDVLGGCLWRWEPVQWPSIDGEIWWSGSMATGQGFSTYSRRRKRLAFALKSVGWCNRQIEGHLFKSHVGSTSILWNLCFFSVKPENSIIACCAKSTVSSCVQLLWIARLKRRRRAWQLPAWRPQLKIWSVDPSWVCIKRRGGDGPTEVVTFGIKTIINNPFFWMVVLNYTPFMVGTISVISSGCLSSKPWTGTHQGLGSNHLDQETTESVMWSDSPTQGNTMK